MTLYSLRTADGSYRITKFDDDLNPEASYEVSSSGCTCPAGHRPSCRHRQMFPLMFNRVDSPFLYDYDNREWVELPQTNPEVEEIKAEEAPEITSAQAIEFESPSPQRFISTPSGPLRRI